MAVGLSPIGNDAPFTLSGAALSGGKLFIYAAGSTTKATSYSDSGGSTPNANPLVTNSSGYPASAGNRVAIWLTTGASYKFVLAPSTDTDPPTSPYWTLDNIPVVNDVSPVQNEWVGGPTPTYISATQFTLVGDQTTVFHRGRRLKFTVTAGTVYGTIETSAFTTLTTITVLMDSTSLDSGLSAVSYAVLSYNNPSTPNNSTFLPGMLMPYAGASAPIGWLLCDGTAYSRVAYAALFAILSTTYGVGDGSTTFNVPDYRGRVVVGDGTGTVAETITSQLAAGNAVPVASNNTKWVTGMPVTVSAASGFVGLVNGSFFIVRASSTTIQIATTLANAQNGTVVTVTGTGTATITGTLTARSRGEIGGEEAHAQSSTEFLLHNHGITDPTHGHTSPIRNAPAGSSTTAVEANANPGDSTVSTTLVATGITINNTGGNAAMNVMQSFGVARYIIKS